MLVLYAVTRAGAEPVPDTERLVCDRVAVVYRTGQQEPRRTRPELLAFAAVLAEIARRGPVLPVRFGTSVSSPVDLHALASTNEDAWAARLDAVHGRSELVVHLRGDLPHTGERDVASGRDYLLGRSRVLRWRDDVLLELGKLLASWTTTDMRTLETEPLRVAALVPTDQAAAVSRLLREWGAERGIEVEVTGPWPPFSFCAEGAA